jgi:hypothetical protein
MPHSVDPVYVILVVVLVLLALTIRGARRRRAVDARLLAQATGHPSTGLRRGISRAQRAQVASDIADQLRQAGLDVLWEPARAVVAARGLDGQYQVDVLADCVVSSYLTNGGVIELGRFAGALAAVRSITEHVGLPTG